MGTIKLNNGYTLGYEEFGDPQGSPMMFFHGTPGSRFFCPCEETTKKGGVRLICVERPGYGLSTFQPGRRITDFPKDIEQLADYLRLETFAVAGHSGGGPYAGACAYALPERVTVAVILSGAGPLDTPEATKGMNAMNKLGLSIGRYVPWVLWQGLVWIFYHQRAEDPGADIDRQTGKRPQADERQISRREVREACIRSETEAFQQGLRGLAWDARLMTRPWGFRLEEIGVPVLLWHGTADDSTPISMGKYVASRIPNSRTHFCDDEAHLLLFPHWEEILIAMRREHNATLQSRQKNK